MGFSYDEMANFTTQDAIDLIDIYIDDISYDDKNTIYKREATQEDIDAFFK